MAETLTKEHIGNMSHAQLLSELKSHWERSAEIDKKYPGIPIPAGDDYEETKRILGEIDLLESALAPLEEAAERSSRIQDNLKKYTTPTQRHQHPETDGDRRDVVKSLGEQFLLDPQYKALRESGVLRSPSFRPDFVMKVDGMLAQMLQKALMYSGSAVGGAFVQNDVQPGLQVPILQRQLSVLDLIPRGNTTSDTIEYVREDTWTNNAAVVAEATAFDSTALGGSGVKPESAFAYSTQTSPVRTIATWVPVTNQQLADAPQIRSIIDARLLMSLNLVLESQVITGNGTGTFTGLTNASGINVQGIGTDNAADAILKGMNQVRVTGLSQPTGVVMHPTDWTALRLLRENSATGTLGGYLMGPPSVAGPMTLWGRPVVESMGIPTDTALTGDFAQCMLFDREDALIRSGYINDQFIKNMVTLLAELRAAFIVWRGAAFSKITGV